MVSDFLMKIHGLNVRDRRALNPAVKAAILETMHRYMTEVYPKHFTAAGAAEYGYQRRKFSTMIRKAKQGHQAPLVHTGQLRAEALTRWRATATSTGGRIVINVPQHAAARGKSGANPDMIRELGAVSSRDNAMIGRFLEEALARRIRAEDLQTSSAAHYSVPSVGPRSVERRAGRARPLKQNIRNARYFVGRF